MDDVEETDPFDNWVPKGGFTHADSHAACKTPQCSSTADSQPDISDSDNAIRRLVADATARAALLNREACDCKSDSGLAAKQHGNVHAEQMHMSCTLERGPASTFTHGQDVFDTTYTVGVPTQDPDGTLSTARKLLDPAPLAVVQALAADALCPQGSQADGMPTCDGTAAPGKPAQVQTKGAPKRKTKSSRKLKNKGRHAPLRQASSSDDSDDNLDEPQRRKGGRKRQRGPSNRCTPPTVKVAFAVCACTAAAMIGIRRIYYTVGRFEPSGKNIGDLVVDSGAGRHRMAPLHPPAIPQVPVEPPPSFPPSPSPLVPLESPPPPSPVPVPPMSAPVASFLAIGDWGYLDEWRPHHRRSPGDHGFGKDWRTESFICTPECQGLLANEMAKEAHALEGTEKPVKFVINAGDNFYPAGVSSVHDPVWELEWGQFYKGLPSGLPWFSVYGNHDYGQFNRICACDLSDAGHSAGSTDGKKTCAQVQKHGAVHGGQRWHMPAMSYYSVPIPGINLEIIALDLNWIDADRTCPWIACGREHCSHSEAVVAGCTLDRCTAVMKKRADAAISILSDRVEAASKAGTQLIVVTHYPSSWIAHVYSHGRTIENILSNPAVDVLYFGAHVHSTDNTSNVYHGLRRRGWHDFCIGGGGGWACDGQQGFVVGEILDNGRVTNLRLRMMDNGKCCRSNPHGG